MEGVLLGVIAVLALLVVVDLALTLAVIRRLRQHMPGSHQADPPFSKMVGRPVPDFTTTATDGSEVTAEALRTGRAFVAFLAVGCGGCHDQLPQLREHVAKLRDAGEHVLVVVNGSDAGASEFVDAFGHDAHIVVENDDASLNAAFGIDGYPTYLVVDDGVVADVHVFTKELSAPVTA